MPVTTLKKYWTPAKLDKPPSISNVSAVSLDLWWEAPNDDGGGVDKYNIYAQTRNQGNYTLKQSTTGRRAILTGLIPKTEYTFKVSAVNQAGEGPLSDASVVAKTEHTTTELRLLAGRLAEQDIFRISPPIFPAAIYDIMTPLNRANFLYTLKGLPDGSGLFINSTGFILGSPLPADGLADQPINITVLVTNANGAGVKGTVQLWVAATSVEAGEYVELALAPLFTDLGAGPKTYSSSLLPAGSGLSTNPSDGTLFGTPNSIDAAQHQPMPLKITATSSEGASQTIQFLLLVTPMNQRPVSSPIPPMDATVNTIFTYNISSYFWDPEGLPLTYTLEGLPKGTGFIINASTGVISGQPGPSDALVEQPMNLTVVATDVKGLKATQSFQASVAAVTATAAEPFLVSVAPLFSLQAGPGETISVRSYTLEGMAVDTGLTITDQGVIKGSPSPADLFQPQPMPVKVVGLSRRCRADNVCSDERLSTRFLMRVLPLAKNEAPKKLIISNVSALVGHPFALDLDTLFVDPDGHNITYLLDDSHEERLPAGTGLGVENNAIVGTPTLVDAAQDQPLRIRLVASDMWHEQAHEAVDIFVFKNDAPYTNGTFAPMTVVVGKPFTLDSAKYFNDPDGHPLTFKVQLYTGA